jgi:hypothetical protein
MARKMGHSRERLYDDATGTAASACSAYCQEFFVEAADFFGAVNEMDFKDPVALLAFGVLAAHFPGIVGMDVEGDFIVGDSFVGELADEVAGDGAAVFPAVSAGHFLGVAVEFVGGYVRVGVEILFPLGEGFGDVVAEF